MTQQVDQPIEFYLHKKSDFVEILEDAQAKANQFSYIRLGVVIGLIPILLICRQFHWVALVVALLLCIALFVYAVIRQQFFNKKANRYENLIAIVDNELINISEHSNIYTNGEKYVDEKHNYTTDLDIFGPHSLFHLINRTKTYHGNAQLADSLTILSDRATIEEKQIATKELEYNREWLLEFQADLFPLEREMENTNVYQEINSLLDDQLINNSWKWLKVVVMVMPFMSIAVILASIFTNEIGSVLLIGLFIMNLIITGKYAKEISQIQSKLGLVANQMEPYEHAITNILHKDFEAKYLKESIPQHTGDQIVAISQLKGIMQRLDYRLNLIVAVILNGLLLWDIKIMIQLSQWKSLMLHKLESTFEMIGVFEKIGSLGIFGFNHPHGSYPELKDDFNIQCDNVQHPLMVKTNCVANDFVMTPTENIGIITGSNMSGKSTFLRTLGINMVLGYAGAKCVADKMAIPLVQLMTYMRIKDSLEENVSTFKSELNRISKIIDAIKAGEQPFILIDEMLRGTNSKDKLQGSIAFTKMLIETNSTAIIATHDIQLAEFAEKASDQVRNYYFDIDYDDAGLVFDYKIKPGICNNFNATYLLKNLGLDMDA